MARNSANIHSDINFIFEIGSVRYIRRMWTRFLGGDYANLAEHHFRVLWISMILAEREDADVGKVAKLALVHDIAESRAGDVDYLARQYVERNEELGVTDMLAGTTVETEFLALWHEYEVRESLESRIVKDADNLDVDFELAEQAANGNQLQKKWLRNRQIVADTKLYTESAKQIFEQLKTADPHDWHANGRNRINDGDWTPGKPD